MTVIVGAVVNGKIYMGADSAGSNGYLQLTVRKDKKLFRNGPYLIGCCGSFRMTQLLRYSFQPPVCDDGEDVEQFMATRFIDAVRECFKAGGYAAKSQEVESGGQFLVGYRGRLFQIEGDYQVGESVDGYDAVGSGADLALGALSATKRELDQMFTDLIYDMPDLQNSFVVNWHIMPALQAAENHNAAVRGPFHVESLNMEENNKVHEENREAA